MPIDFTPYEGNNRLRMEQSANLALGRIVNVDIKTRTCTISTVTGRDSICNNYIEGCQWLSQDANPEGDESGSIPRRGSWGMVYYVDGQAFIGGFIKPLGELGTTLRGNEAATLNEGDKIISTLAGNRFTLKRSGLIELFVSENLKRLLIPTSGQLVDHCRTYNFKADGGFFDWRFDKLLNTLWTSEYYTNAARLFVMEEKKGYASSELVYSRTVGPGFPGVPGSSIPVYSKTIGITGETITAISPPLPAGSPSGYKSTLGPDGSIEVLAGAAQTVKFTVAPTGATQLNVNSLVDVAISETGDIDIAGPVGMATMNKLGDIKAANAAASLSMAKTGDVEIKTPTATMSMAAAGDIIIKNTVVTVTISVGGEVSISAPNKVTIEGKAGVDIKSMGPVNIQGLGPVSVKALGLITLDGGPGASDNVLTFPTTLSPFTGAPLVPFSTTVMVSK